MGKIIFVATVLGYPKGNIYNAEDNSIFCQVKTREELIVDIEKPFQLRAKLGPNFKSDIVNFSPDKVTKVTFGFIGIKTDMRVLEEISIDEYEEPEDMLGKPVFEYEGARGRSIKVYEDKCVIKTKTTVGSLLSGNATDGEKIIYYCDVIGVQFKMTGVTLGYLQLETASSSMNNKSDNHFNENSFTFNANLDHEIDKVAKYIRSKVDELKRQKNTPVVVAAANSSADELKKFKELLDMGVITQEEFDQKKKELLGL